MATLVKGLSHGKPVWWVIDTLVDRVMQLEDWGKRISKLSIVEGGSDLRFYVSEPEKFLPSFGEYSLSQLQLQEYHGYFDDLGRMLLAQ